MGTISVKLKMIADNDTKAKIYEAYSLYNESIKMFEDFFIMAQQKDYYYKDENGEEIYVTKEETKARLRQYLNENTTTSDVDKCMEVLSKLSAVLEQKKSMATGMLAKIYNKDSSAGVNNIAKIVSPQPEWMEHFSIKDNSFDDARYKKEADIWIKSKEGKRAIAPILEGSGRPSAFKQKYLAGKEWYQAFCKDQKTYSKDLEDGLSNVLVELDKIDALPLIPLPKELVDSHPIWIKLHLKQAIENYCSYIECDAMTREDYETICKQCEIVEDEAEQYNIQLQKTDEFLEFFYNSDYHKMCLNERMCRGYSELYILWGNVNTEEERIAVIDEIQSDKKRQRNFGDVNFFKWLAKEENQDITEEVLEVLLKRDRLLMKKNIKKCCACFTSADPVLSQRYLFYENESGSNFKKYHFYEENNVLYMTFPILLKKSELFLEENVTVAIAKSRQFRGPYDEERKEYKRNIEITDKCKVRFSNSKKIFDELSNAIMNEEFEGKLGGIDVRPELSISGKVKDYYASIVVTISDLCSDETKKLNEALYYEFNSAYSGNKSKRAEEFHNKELRALSIDLGLKQIGACAVGKIKFDASRLSQNVEIERQFMIRLPGEITTKKIDEARNKAEKKLYSIRQSIRYLSFIKSVYTNPDLNVKNEKLNQRLKYTNDSERSIVLKQCLETQSEKEKNELLELEYIAEFNRVSNIMQEFRSGENTKKQYREYGPGKSYWAILYLEELRKTLLAWNAINRDITATNFAMDKEYGVTATRLLEHINNLKEDRVKTAADMIVQAARGYIYDEENACWHKKYATCNAIVFENLHRYVFQMDRPKRENSKLMKWSHSAILDEVTRQAELYGIKVFEVDAAYSSKFNNRTQAPGIRCDRLSSDSFEANGILKKQVYEMLPKEMQEVSHRLKIGDVVPAEIGSLFVTLDNGNKISVLNADLNAACNLQNRFWKQQTHLFMLSTENKKGYLYIKNSTINENDDASVGKLVKGKFLYNFGTGNVTLEEGNIKGQFRVGKNGVPPYVGSKVTYSLMRDQSGVFFDSESWVGYRDFWITIRNRIVKKLVDLV